MKKGGVDSAVVIAYALAGTNYEGNIQVARERNRCRLDKTKLIDGEKEVLSERLVLHL